jgi:hypothetical protein
MLGRARRRLLRGARLRVPVVDAEALIGLKLQALVNAPARRAREEADIEALFAAQRGSLNAATSSGTTTGSSIASAISTGLLAGREKR